MQWKPPLSIFFSHQFRLPWKCYVGLFDIVHYIKFLHQGSLVNMSKYKVSKRFAQLKNPSLVKCKALNYYNVVKNVVKQLHHVPYTTISLFHSVMPQWSICWHKIRFLKSKEQKAIQVIKRISVFKTKEISGNITILVLNLKAKIK